jgi:hypothetical protein
LPYFMVMRCFSHIFSISLICVDLNAVTLFPYKYCQTTFYIGLVR